MGHVRGFFRNPFSQAALAVLLGLALTKLSVHLEGEKQVIWSKVFESVAAAFVVYAVFGIAFEYLGKKDLISSVVDVAVGQNKSNSFGLADLELSASRVNYRNDIVSSSELIVSTRYSTRFFENNKDDIISRLSQKKKILVIRMADTPLTRLMPAYPPPQTVDDFFRKITNSDAKILKCVSLMDSICLFSYNFVVVDRGIWLKFYWNDKRSDTPPAIFVATGTELYSKWRGDIDGLIKTAQKVTL